MPGGRGSIPWLLVPAYALNAAPRNTDYVNRNYGYNLIGVIRRKEGGIHTTVRGDKNVKVLLEDAQELGIM